MKQSIAQRIINNRTRETALEILSKLVDLGHATDDPDNWGNTTRYTFRDGSAILVTPDAAIETLSLSAYLDDAMADGAIISVSPPSTAACEQACRRLHEAINADNRYFTPASNGLILFSDGVERWAMNARDVDDLDLDEIEDYQSLCDVTSPLKDLVVALVVNDECGVWIDDVDYPETLTLTK